MILVDPYRGNVYSDQPCWPLDFAGLVALHHDADGQCAEDALDWPCTTARLVRATARCTL